MSKMVIVCCRNKNMLGSFEGKIRTCFEKITPQHFTPKTPVIKRYSDTLVGIFNPVESAYYQDSQCSYIGTLFTNRKDYMAIGEDAPDGNFSLARYNTGYLEILADVSAMYTMWYILTPEYFIASSSQRIVISLLQGFEENPMAWMHFLCRGTLGLGQSWDRRLSHVKSRERVMLDKARWKLSIKRAALPEQVNKKSHDDEILLNQLQADIDAVLSTISINWSNYRLPLSGGYDSRYLYMFFQKNNPRLKTISWSNAQSLQDEYSDSYLAQKITSMYNTDHTVYFMDKESPYSQETVLEKYLTASEGRIDHINVYMDGMLQYETICNNSITGYIRGTQAFGTKNRASIDEKAAYRPFAFLHPEYFPEYSNLRLLVNRINDIWAPQELPPEFEKTEDENWFQWGERVWLDYSSHILFSALNEIKLTYIDVMHPFMSDQIIRSTWRLPDHLRENNKIGFRRLVESITPPVPFAKKYATPSVDEICKNNFMDIILPSLQTAYARNLLSGTLIDFILEGVGKNHDRKLLQDTYINPSFERMAFRAYIIVSMNQTLATDSRLFV